MPQLTYGELVAELFPRLTGGIRWGLERTQRLLAHVGDPHMRFRVVHVGGTNGKGSVAATVESVLRRAGHCTGLYTSPHLCTFRERIRIDGRPVSEEALLAAAERLWPVIRHEQASFFEATTAIAFLALAEAGVEIAVIEVGLGGRLDSTNVVTPDVVILTNVALDHIQLLGPTLRHVAIEKAGIIKAGVPVVTAETAQPAAAVFGDAAAAAGAPLRTLTDADVAAVEVSTAGTALTVRGTGWGELRVRTPLVGVHQARNTALAVHALDVLGPGRPAAADVIAGVASVEWPGRLQIERIAGVLWIFDVAHNVAGVAALAQTLDTLELPRPLVAVVGVLGDKDWAGMLGPLHEVTDRLVLTMPPTAPPDRRWDPAEARRALPPADAEIIVDFTRALERAHAEAAAGHGTVLVTGSVHTVGDALAALHRCTPDSDVAVAAPAFL